MFKLDPVIILLLLVYVLFLVIKETYVGLAIYNPQKMSAKKVKDGNMDNIYRRKVYRWCVIISCHSSVQSYFSDWLGGLLPGACWV